MKKALALLMAFILCFLAAGALAESTEAQPAYKLEQVVVLSRHNIRSPLSEKGSVVSDITPHEWFTWTSNPGELSLRGAMLETTMGQYFRLWLEKEGLFPENYIPEEGAVRFYANGYQRTQATAHYFSTGLLPVAVVPVERKNGYNEPDETFLPIVTYMNDEYRQEVLDEIAERGGGDGLSGYRAALEPAFELIKNVTDMEESEAYQAGKYGNFDEDLSGITVEEGDEPRMYGPMKYLNSVADALVLQYYEEPDDLKAAFGHELTEEDWKTIGSVLATYEKILFTTPKLAANMAHPMLEEIYSELNNRDRKFTFLCGHDSTVTSFLAALGTEAYELPGAVETTTPIGIKVVFERWSDPQGQNYYQVNLVYQSAEQMRTLQPLSLDIPPMIVHISFEGVPVNADGMIAEADLMNLFRDKIGALDAIRASWGEEPEQALPEKDITVLFTSDVHCGVDQNFTYAGLKAIKDNLADSGMPVLLVDNGDSVQGESIGILSQGMADIELMNAMGYDLAIPGNHEFDYGVERFFELVEAAEFPYISCNFHKNGELVFDPYLIKEIAGVKIGFVGTTTPEALTTSRPRYFQDAEGNFLYDFSQGNNGETFYWTVQDAVDSARADGAQYVIVLGHLGNEGSAAPYTYADLIANTTGIDAVLDGHSHDTEKVVMLNRDGEKVVRQACGTKLAGIGWLRISAADGSVDTGLYTWNNDITAPELFGIRNNVGDQIESMRSAQAAELSEIVGFASVELTVNDPVAVDGSGRPIRLIRNAETNLGDLSADAIRAAAGAEIGLCNGGAIRVSIPAGDITMNSVLSVFPFGNKLMMVEAAGQQILDALEWGARAVPEECGGFLHVSGLAYEINPNIPTSCTADDNGMFTGVAGERRVQNVTVGGEPLDPEKTYTVASQSYILMDGGDGHTAFRGAKILWESPLADFSYLMSYIRGALGGVVGEGYENPYGQGRIVAVAESEAEAGPALPELPEGVVPVTWDVSADDLMIRTDEARELYERIVAGDYPTMEELKAHPVVAQLDALAAYYKALYGNTADIDTPERNQLRQEKKEWFLTLGSARTESIDENGKHHYVYDGELKREYRMELVLGLPASGKSTRIVDPDSEEMGAFVLDPDVIKEQLPEYIESHAAGADAIHFEGMMIFDDSLEAFLAGDLKGVNVILPIVGTDLDELMEKYIRPFEEAGYNVKVKFCEAKPNEAAARVVMRELRGGQLINSQVAFNFGAGVVDVYEQLKDMVNACGEPYGVDEDAEEELAPAA